MDDLLFLAYTFETTQHADTHPGDFWAWMADRNEWFYEGLTMVLDTRWRIEHQDNGQLIHHEVLFADESGLASYREALRIRSRDEAWERRRTSQDRWYRIVARSVQTSPPVSMALFPRMPRSGSPGRAVRPLPRSGASAGGHSFATQDDLPVSDLPVSWIRWDPLTAGSKQTPIPWYSVHAPSSAAQASTAVAPAPPEHPTEWRPLLTVILAAILLGCSLTAWAVNSLP
ncbi:hypothetical protein [Streptomyces sp. NPDC090080]|uniref:hypothetical protein n=1 Tax=Streptomyces sp. NPDC090080 TaxID=3365939 RepID=UPI0037F20482